MIKYMISSCTDHGCAADNRQVQLAYAVNYAEQGLADARSHREVVFIPC